MVIKPKVLMLLFKVLFIGLPYIHLFMYQILVWPIFLIFVFYFFYLLLIKTQHVTVIFNSYFKKASFDPPPPLGTMQANQDLWNAGLFSVKLNLQLAVNQSPGKEEWGVAIRPHAGSDCSWQDIKFQVDPVQAAWRPLFFSLWMTLAACPPLSSPADSVHSTVSVS